MSNISFAIELRGALPEPGALRDAGFSFALLHAEPRPGAAHPIAARLASAGIKIIAVALPAEFVLRQTQAALETAEACGAPDLALLLDGAQLKEPASLAAWARDIREPAAEITAAGIRPLLGFHHMQSLDYSAAVMRVAHGFPPGLLDFMPDTVEITSSASPSAPDIIRALPDRCPLLVLGDLLPGHENLPCPLGEGRLDWDAIFDAGEEAAAEWYICRAENTATGLETARRSLAYLADRA